MSAHNREQWEAWGLQSSQALTLTEHIRKQHHLGQPERWVAGVEKRAIAAFVSFQSAAYLKHNGEAVREDMIVACARFGVDPAWFFTDESGEVTDESGVRELRADVAHYRIMYSLDEEDE